MKEEGNRSTQRKPLTTRVRKLCRFICFQRSYWARGRVLGGSSSLNYMAYVRGHRLDYDQWAEQGNEGWSYKDVLPYFIKSEDNYDEDLVRSGRV